MKRNAAVVIVLVILLCVGLIVFLNKSNENTIEEVQVPQSSESSDEFYGSGNSAPPQALQACRDKSFGDTCTFNVNGSRIDGVCAASGDLLACGLNLPSS